MTKATNKRLQLLISSYIVCSAIFVLLLPFFFPSYSNNSIFHGELRHILSHPTVVVGYFAFIPCLEIYLLKELFFGPKKLPSCCTAELILTSALTGLLFVPLALDEEAFLIALSELWIDFLRLPLETILVHLPVFSFYPILLTYLVRLNIAAYQQRRRPEPHTKN